MSVDKDHKDRLRALRTAISRQKLDGFIIPRADEYQGEFVAPYAERLKWLSGFTGSGGTAVVLRDRAALLTDGRYTLQAAQQVDGDAYEVVDIMETSLADWLDDHVDDGRVAGYDPRLHTPKQLQDIREKGVEIQPSPNLVDELWEDQPPPPGSAVELFPEYIAGLSAEEKRDLIAAELEKNDITWAVITLPDSIAWLLNIRGRDTDYIPLALSYLAIDREGHVAWFIEPARVPDEVREKLGGRIEIVHPKIMEEHLGKMVSGIRAGLDFKRSPDWFRLVMEEQGAEVVDFKDPCILPKSLKTLPEQNAIKAAHVRDGMVLTKFLAWVQREAPAGHLTELSVGEKLTELRAQDRSFRGPSFPPIVGFGPNGAIVHYRASDQTNREVKGDGLLLVDSGGQYDDGTTDITRTVLIGEATDEMKENFTRVLQGHIAVDKAQFKAGTTGKEIDALARAPLQEVGLNYAHGTGHGVGCFLAVHEEAANLSPRGEDELRPGILLSNEPGYYKEGEYGIRTENLVLVKEIEAGTFGFETVSLAPVDRRLVMKDMLSEEELDWLDAYHKRVWETLSSFLDEEDRSWLESETQPL